MYLIHCLENGNSMWLHFETSYKCRNLPEGNKLPWGWFFFKRKMFLLKSLWQPNYSSSTKQLWWFSPYQRFTLENIILLHKLFGFHTTSSLTRSSKFTSVLKWRRNKTKTKISLFASIQRVISFSCQGEKLNNSKSPILIYFR